MDQVFADVAMKRTSPLIVRGKTNSRGKRNKQVGVY